MSIDTATRGVKANALVGGQQASLGSTGEFVDSRELSTATGAFSFRDDNDLLRNDMSTKLSATQDALTAGIRPSD
ncbi:hypothetical protein [Rhizobium laguerreae]|uniref:hypothetical protein n=1 Tax=Rhizobium laguerreae TaxID=1076926 RepID=UPI001C92508E|nr:hypothetical protein [Rhizobium laguerreae]MBY3568913.1 hypothetical protein [Rhizobium laguerreae]